MNAADMFTGVDYVLLEGSLDVDVTSLVEDSREVTEGAVFVCRAGTQTDGHLYIDEAVRSGAAGVIVTDDMRLTEKYRPDVFIVKMCDYRHQIGRLCNNFWGFPSAKLVVIGVTGTKGKTTTACMIHRMINAWGRDAGLISTIEIDDGMIHTPAKNTTPDVMYVHRKLADMVQNGMEYCVIEVSSQGLMKNRVAGVQFDVGVFTNLSPDHIGANEHSTFEEYARWKEELFSMCKLAVVNRDDVYAPMYAHRAELAKIPVISYGAGENLSGIKSYADCRADRVWCISDGGVLGVGAELRLGSRRGCIRVGMPGRFNIYNALAALAVGDVLGVPDDIAFPLMGQIRVDGRLELIDVSDRFSVVIDYAHNALSLQNVLTTLRSYRPGRLVCLFGCGGNRAKARRTQMGMISGLLADETIITSDNPRMEEPAAIMRDIESGVKQAGGSYVMIEDRRDAIRYALTGARRGDVILLAGKGHERYQDIGGRRIPMDERQIIQEVMEEDAGAVCGCDNRYIPRSDRQGVSV